jgi:hypothetical protein
VSKQASFLPTTANVNNGVLEVTVPAPKREQQPRRIPIQETTGCKGVNDGAPVASLASAARQVLDRGYMHDRYAIDAVVDCGIP